MDDRSPRADLAEVTRRIVRSSRARNRRWLSEPEGMEIAAAAGFAVPDHVVVAGSADVVDPPFRGERAVVKVVSADLVHKSQAGGVSVVPATGAAIADAITGMERRFGADFPVDGYLIAEFVDHQPTAEVLAGVRWTDAFGPVVTLGPGGLAAEQMALEPAIVSAATLGEWISGESNHRLGECFGGRPPPATPSELGAVVATLLDLARLSMPDELAEFEMNPLVFTDLGPMALDVAAALGPAATAAAMPVRPLARLDRLLRPRSIALVGVSERVNPGRVILRNLLASGFPASRISVIKPGVREVEGCRAVGGLAELPEPVDLLIVSVEADSTPTVVDEAISRRAAESVVLIPGGVGEREGSEHLAEQIRAAITRSRSTKWGGPVVVGPNSMGLRSGPLDATFIPPERLTPAAAEEVPVAVVAQSGAFTLSRLDRMPGMRPRFVVTVGNQIDLTLGDYLEYFSAEESVEIVGCYAEGFAPGDGARIVDAAAAIRARGGAVLMARAARTAAGVRSAASHTAAIATDDAVARALLAAAGVLETTSLDEFEDLLGLLIRLRDKTFRGLSLGAVSNAGFECVAVADALGPLGTADFAAATRRRLDAALSGGGLDGIVGVRNPLDLTPAAPDVVFAEAVEAVLDDPGVDLAVVGCIPYTPALQTLPDQVAREGSLPRRLAALAGHPTPWVLSVDAGRRYDPLVTMLEEAGIIVFRSIDRALRVLGRYAAWRRSADAAPGR